MIFENNSFSPDFRPCFRTFENEFYVVLNEEWKWQNTEYEYEEKMYRIIG